MTVKLEEVVSWDMFGYGMIAKRLSTDPTTEDDPIIMFTHKMAVGGKYHNGEPILTKREENAMLKDCDTLIKLLAKFRHNEDFQKVANDYNMRGKNKKKEEAPAPAPVVVSDEGESTRIKGRGGRRKKVVEEAAPVVAETKVRKVRAKKAVPEPAPEPVVAEKPKRQVRRVKAKEPEVVQMKEPEVVQMKEPEVAKVEEPPKVEKPKRQRRMKLPPEPVAKAPKPERKPRKVKAVEKPEPVVEETAPVVTPELNDERQTIVTLIDGRSHDAEIPPEEMKQDDQQPVMEHSET